MINIKSSWSPDPQWLFRRLKGENPSLEPSYSFRATLGWIRGLSILCTQENFERESLISNLKSKVKLRNPANDGADTITCEYIYMALQNLSSLHVIKDARYPHDLSRIAIVAWYYGVFFASKAMIAAYDGSIQENHSSVAKTWDQQIVQRGLIPRPFSLRTSTLVERTYKDELSSFGKTFLISEKMPLTEEEALGACIAYLKGTAKYERGKAENDLKRSPDFKKLNVDNFRTKNARALRDKKLSKKTVCFLHQAFRYRGKANYRDAVYLTYGNADMALLEQFLEDLFLTLRTFTLSATCYCQLRMKQKCWTEFLNDLRKHGNLAVPLDLLKPS